MAGDPLRVMTRHAFDVLRAAHETARARGCARIEPEHLLLALIDDADSPATRLLGRLGIPQRPLLLALLTDPGGELGTGTELPAVASGTTAALAAAIREADAAGAPLVGSEHLLLGLLTVEGTPAWRLLTGHGATLEAARARLAEPEPEPEPEPTIEPIRRPAVSLATGSAVPGRKERLPNFLDGGAPLPRSELETARQAAAGLPSPVERARLARRCRAPSRTEEWDGVPAELSRRSVALLRDAEWEAARFGDSHIGTRHLLLAMTRARETIPGQVLEIAGVTPTRVRRAIELVKGRGTDHARDRRDPSLLVRRIVLDACAEAAALDAYRVEPEHLLLALLDAERGIACGILEELGHRLEPFRGRLLRAIRATPDDPAAA